MDVPSRSLLLKVTIRCMIIVCYVVICTGLLSHTVESAATSNSDEANATELFSNQLNSSSENIDGRKKRDKPSDLDEFFKQRKHLLDNELKSIPGNSIRLTEKELLVNEIIMAVKNAELEAGFLNPDLFNPAHLIFNVSSAIKQSKLFQIISKMPKGGILHIHEYAMCSADFLVSLTYWPDLWQLTSNKTSNKKSNKFSKIEEFQFSREKPTNSNIQGFIDSNEGDKNDLVWRLVKDVRAEFGVSAYDEHVRSQFTLYDPSINPTTQFPNTNDLWLQFINIFIRVGTLIKYMPARRAYYMEAFKEMYEDGVQYVEIRATLSKVHDLDGKFYTDDQSIQIYFDAIHEFKLEHPLFIGAKFIFAKNKNVSKENILNYFKAAREWHAKYPELVVGFDLVSQEDKAPPLWTLAEHILQLPDGLKCFFHAGETSWFGSYVDENLIDAVLLGSRRIGHGYALAKHPQVIDLIKRNDIAVEVSPISNQVLKLVSDLRNHPASVLFAQNVPIVISSDDPSFWEVSPLSHDFYVTFLGIASQHSDLRTLKQLALNSIRYSSLEGYEELEAVTKWKIKWDAFIDGLLWDHQ